MDYRAVIKATGDIFVKEGMEEQMIEVLRSVKFNKYFTLIEDYRTREDIEKDIREKKQFFLDVYFNECGLEIDTMPLFEFFEVVAHKGDYNPDIIYYASYTDYAFDALNELAPYVDEYKHNCNDGILITQEDRKDGNLVWSEEVLNCKETKALEEFCGHKLLDDISSVLCEDETLLHIFVYNGKFVAEDDINSDLDSIIYDMEDMAYLYAYFLLDVDKEKEYKKIIADKNFKDCFTNAILEYDYDWSKCALFVGNAMVTENWMKQLKQLRRLIPYIYKPRWEEIYIRVVDLRPYVEGDADVHTFTLTNAYSPDPNTYRLLCDGEAVPELYFPNDQLSIN